MSKRNFILLIIIVLVVLIAALGYFYSTQEPVTPENPSGGNNFFSQFNPFKDNPPPTPPVVTPPTASPTPNPEPEEIPLVKLKKVSSMPVAGFGIFLKERLKEVPLPPPETTTTETTTQTPQTTTTTKTTVAAKPTAPPTEFAPAVRYASRAEGVIYQTFLDKLEERKFSATVIPKIHEALFGNKGSSVIMRYLKGDDRTIETFVGTIPKEVLGGDTTSVNEVKGFFLPNNVTDISISQDKTKAFYLFNQDGNSFGNILNLADGKRTQIFDSPFTEWLSNWPRSTTIHLTTKPSWNTPGYAYSLDTTTKNLSLAVGEVNGLSTLGSPDGRLILYSDYTLALRLYNTTTKDSTSVGLRTMPEKCVWGKGSDVIYCAAPRFIQGTTYPDLWYQGEVSFSDEIWRINITSGNTSIIADPATILGGEEVDGIKLALDESEKYLLFVNKKNSILWELELN